MLWQYSDRDSLRGKKSRFSTSILLWDDFWSVECYQEIAIVMYVDNMQKASSFRPISVDGNPEQNLFVHIGKSEATITNNKKTNNALEVYCIVKAN